MEENGSLGGVHPYQINNKRPLDDELSHIFINRAPHVESTTISFQVWKEPHLMDYYGGGGGGGSSGATKALSTTTNTPFSVVLSEKEGPEAEFPSFFNGGNTTGLVVSGGDNNNSKESLDKMVHVFQFRFGRKIDPNMDPKKIKRVISNRISAQRSRLKKIQYISDLENSVKTLEIQVSSLSPQIAKYKIEYQLSQLEHNKLTQQMLVYTNQELLKEVEIEQNKTEVNRLRLIYFKQQQQQQLLQQQQQKHFQAPSMVLQIPPKLAQGFPLLNQMPNFSSTLYHQPGLIFPPYPNPNVEFGGNSGGTTRTNPTHAQDQTELGSNPTHVHQEMNSTMMPNHQQVMRTMAQHDQVQDQTRQAWTTVDGLPTANFINKWEPKQLMPSNPFCSQTNYNGHSVSKPEYA